MSVNRNRAYLEKAEDGTTYSKYIIKYLYPPYYCEGWNWSTNISNQDRRSYRSWKHNRKKQWKEKNLISNKEEITT